MSRGPRDFNRRNNNAGGQAGTFDNGRSQRRTILALGKEELLRRAKAHYRGRFKAIGENPFCQRCTRALKERRFASLCERCILDIGKTPYAGEATTR